MSGWRSQETNRWCPDLNVTADVYAAGGVDIPGAKGSISVSGCWSWDTFNLRAGLGYGHYTLPAANIFVPEAFFFPELALYWRY